jgi:hypothetical protein
MHMSEAPFRSKFTPGSIRAKLTPEQRASMEEFDKNFGRVLAENLNRNVLAQDEKDKQERASSAE